METWVYFLRELKSNKIKIHIKSIIISSNIICILKNTNYNKDS